jgi:MFS family permease
MGERATATPRQQLLPLRQLLTLSIYWLGIQTIWGGLNQIVVPARLDDLNRDTSGTMMGILLIAGAIAAIIVQPTVGMISDFTVSRWGRRKPYIVIGTAFDMLFLAGLAFGNQFLAILAFYFLLQVSSNFAQGPFQGYVPDLVPGKQVGLASGLMGLMLALGTIVGVGIATVGGAIVGEPLTVMALGVVELGTMVLLVTTVREGSDAPPRTKSWVQVALSAWGKDILQERDVLWLLVVRLFFLGAFNATVFGYAYFTRTHGLPDQDAKNTVFLATAIVGVVTLLAALPAGRLSDRFGRRPVIWVAAALCAVAMLGVTFAPSREFAIAAWVPFGLGIGTFLSADWALMADVIPKDSTGRYMGILNAGTAMAGPLYTAIAGPILDLVAANFGDPIGPRAAMLTAGVLVVLSGLALTRVNPRRREAEPIELEASAATPPPAVTPA